MRRYLYYCEHVGPFRGPDTILIFGYDDALIVSGPVSRRRRERGKEGREEARSRRRLERSLLARCKRASAHASNERATHKRTNSVRKSDLHCLDRRPQSIVRVSATGGRIRVDRPTPRIMSTHSFGDRGRSYCYSGHEASTRRC